MTSLINVLLLFALFPVLTLASPSFFSHRALLPSPLSARALEVRLIDPSTVPTQCQSACGSALNTLNACTTQACTCSAANSTGLTSCVGCLDGLGAAQGQEGQDVLDDVTQACAQADLPVEQVLLGHTAGHGTHTHGTSHAGMASARDAGALAIGGLGVAIGLAGVLVH
ncbi:hypothetical protein FA95DRAFT_1556008 [Auriscalpium vulgare]|uniref:Uncharacterized protein n=1 Tax=Auriscalpium vulgare TaxID=40419 RepID=A0ACB8S1S5_9AGAM|nr:hypothetical protein FA95DRAFT_1556008 [Auriscalpium vulgare]